VPTVNEKTGTKAGKVKLADGKEITCFLVKQKTEIFKIAIPPTQAAYV